MTEEETATICCVRDNNRFLRSEQKVTYIVEGECDSLNCFKRQIDIV